MIDCIEPLREPIGSISDRLEHHRAHRGSFAVKVFQYPVDTRFLIEFRFLGVFRPGCKVLSTPVWILALFERPTQCLLAQSGLFRCKRHG